MDQYHPIPTIPGLYLGRGEGDLDKDLDSGLTWKNAKSNRKSNRKSSKIFNKANHGGANQSQSRYLIRNLS